MSPHPRIQATRWVERANALASAAPSVAGTAKLVRGVPPLAPATLPGVLPAQLWLAVHVPQIEFAAFEAGADRGAAGPQIIVDRDSRPPRVRVACPRALALGIHPGQALTAALALARDLQVQPRSLPRERAALESLAGSGFALTSWVSLEPPDAVLLEVRGSLRLFGGEAALLAAARERAALSLGAAAATPLCVALAPTPLAALVLARAAGLARDAARAPIDPLASQADPALLVSRLAPLPLGLLRWPPELLERLATLGVRSIGEALRLPRSGFARRFGKAQLLALDQLLGRVRTPRPAFVPRERFAARCEPAHELCDAAAIQRAAEPLLAQLEQFLRRRQIGITLLVLGLRHRAAPGALRGEGALTRIALRLAAPELAAARFAFLLGERLAQTALPGPVRQLELRTGAGQPFAPGPESLWQPGEHGGAAGAEAPAFIERLRARLGAEAVYGLCLLPAHRPEAAWAVAEPAPPASRASPAGAQRPAGIVARPASYHSRPLWLLKTPEPLAVEQDALAAAGLHLLGGPERIETGWWDGSETLRDYYIARDAAGAELWLYRERQAPHRWFLQGLFG